MILRKIGFAFSIITTLMGLLTIIIASIISAIMPKVGLAAYQMSPNSIYYDRDSYFVDFSFTYIVAAVLIINGIVFAICFYEKEKSIK